MNPHDKSTKARKAGHRPAMSDHATTVQLVNDSGEPLVLKIHQPNAKLRQSIEQVIAYYDGQLFKETR